MPAPCASGKVAAMTRICQLCGKPIPEDSSRWKYCSAGCAEFCARTKEIDGRRVRRQKEYVKRPKFHDMICKDCGKTYRGHFNSKYCDTCLTERHMKYYENRVFLEEDAQNERNCV